MATYTVAEGDRAKHGLTLVASQVDTVTFTDNVNTVEIWNDGDDPVYYTNDGSTPTVAGGNCFVVPPSAVDRRPVRSSKSIKVISSGTPTLSVIGD